MCPTTWAQEATRKRRVNPAPPAKNTPTVRDGVARTAFKVPAAYSSEETHPTKPPVLSPEKRSQSPVSSPEKRPQSSVLSPQSSNRGLGPEIRIGLATNADFVSITCDGPLARVDVQNGSVAEVADNKITVQLNTGESRRQRGKTYRVQVASFKKSAEADETAKKLRRKFDEPVVTRFDRENQQYVVSVGEYSTSSEAQTMMVRVLNAGYRKPWVERDQPAALNGRNKNTPRWQLRAVDRDGDEIARDAQIMTFTALDGDRAPLKYLGSTYRGKLEIFLNRRQRITVVNVLPMEEYVRGVVPNELSPNAFPQLEALKAQAVAARTYAVRNRGNFSEEGFDLLPTALSQVYGGRSTEHAMTDQAVAETRGVVATYNGEPINALYTSTSGGRTENSEFVFGKPVPYLKSVVTAPQDRVRRNDRWIETERKTEAITDAEGRSLTRELALLTIAGFQLPERVSASYLTSTVNSRECEQWGDKLSLLARQKPVSAPPRTVTELGGFARLVTEALWGSESPSTLLTEEDARYLLGSEQASIPENFRADVAYLVREGIIRPFSDGTLRPRTTLTHATALAILARAAVLRSVPKLENGNARPFSGDRLTLRGGKGKEDFSFPLSPRLYLFRKLGGEWFPTSRTELIGGEAVNYHLDSRGRVDYLEIAPVLNGATSDRFSQFSWWDVALTPEEVKAQIAKANVFVGEVLDLQPVSLGVSHRVAQLRIVGRDRSATVDGIHIRSVLGVRENLFVVERSLDEHGRVKSFRIRGRGWGHGVGMCQVGAYGLAVEGYSYDQILKHFYSGVQMTKLY
ncbi:MAG: SpoIID/LytB domain-containing protein [Blastocatellia bacterium]|nr:SpoIID/LytB domain-containing protein [Blastocatellia bacterium]